MFLYLFSLFIFKIIHRHNNLGLTSTWGRRLPFVSLSRISLVPRSMVQGARGFGGTIRENFFYLLLMNDMHDTIFFFLVYFVGVTVRIVAGAGELVSFSRLCSFNPLVAFRVHNVTVAFPDFRFKYVIILHLTPVICHRWLCLAVSVIVCLWVNCSEDAKDVSATESPHTLCCVLIYIYNI